MKCKPGDLAIVIRSSGGYSDANVGRIVSVDSPADRYPEWWQVTAQGSPLVHGLSGEPLDSAIYPDHALEPIRGKDEADLVERERELALS